MSKRNFTHDLAWTTAVNIAATLLGLLTGVMLARILGPEGRGALAAIQNPATILFGVGALGITTAAAYFSGRDPSLAGRLMTTALVALLLWSIPLVAIAYLMMPFLLDAQSASVIHYAQIYLLMIPIQFAAGAPLWVLQGLGKFKLWNILRFQAPVAWLAVIGLTWMLGMVTAGAISLFYLAVMICVACVFVVLALRKVPPPHQPEVSHLPTLLRYGLPASLTAVPQQLNLRLDQLLMATFLSADTLGLYVVAVAWSGAFSPLLTSVSQVVFPRLAATHDQQVQAETLHRTLRLCVLSAAMLAVMLLALTPLVLPLLFGAAFMSAVPAALVLVVAASIASFNQVASDGLRGIGAPKLPMVAEFIGLGTTVVMLVLLLRRYELMGAAVASLASYLVTLATLVFLISRRTQVSPWKMVIPRREDLFLLWDQLLSFRRRLAG
ncbi:MAG: oligosaccharide flippase family protein [Sulfuricaulis sp.]|uniref:oligosaccharide flippase family protein n=1 Tax=Sulfuricaulis sp. TaxID=2003553 RepID=UPI0025EFE931|nr:oligosaccharide flippase family protein [Sulfuricaulis sp.]MCR4348026.1 oligosaccharide flippase family protein [Sulfuricaulis sp.]